jgi:hypothetical protein
MIIPVKPPSHGDFRHDLQAPPPISKIIPVSRDMRNTIRAVIDDLHTHDRAQVNDHDGHLAALTGTGMQDRVGHHLTGQQNRNLPAPTARQHVADEPAGTANLLHPARHCQRPSD